MPQEYPVALDAKAVAALLEHRQGCTALVDVRQPWENEICALPGSLNIPLDDLPRRAEELPKEGALIVICHHGARSERAVAWLRAHGFPNAINLRGGIDAWAREIDPTVPTY